MMPPSWLHLPRTPFGSSYRSTTIGAMSTPPADNSQGIRAQMTAWLLDMDLDDAQHVIADASDVWRKHIINQPVLFNRSTTRTEVVFSLAEPSFADAMTVYHLIADALADALPTRDSADPTNPAPTDNNGASPAGPRVAHELVLR